MDRSHAIAVLQGEAEARMRVEEEAALLFQERAQLQVYHCSPLPIDG